MDAHLRIEDLHCSIAGSPVLRGVGFQLRKGEIACLLGPSGCGKTTVLRAIAGFIQPDQGRIVLNGRLLSSPDCMVAPEKRGVSMVFQDYALFPHMTVRDNLAFGLHRLRKEERSRRLDFLLELTRLTPLAKRYPHELSGGQQQRVALARAMAINPDLLLLDEPFSGLDTDLRRELGVRVREILKNQQITAILVTHDQEEAFTVADSIGVMRDGDICQWDSPYNLYHQPGDPFVAGFVGRGAFLPGRISGPGQVATELGELRGETGQRRAGEEVRVLLRPDDLIQDPHSPYKAVVTSKLFIGTNTLYSLRLPSGHQVEAMLPSHENFSVGEQMGARVEAAHLILFD